MRGRLLIRAEKYKDAKKQIYKYLREDEKLLVNYTELELSNDKIKLGWRGKNYVPDRQHINRTDLEAGLSRLRRDMQWDLYFQKREEQRQEDGEVSEEEDRIAVKRVLRDRKLKTNMPTKWSILRALLDFEAGVQSAVTSRQNLKVIRLNLELGEWAAIKDLQDLAKNRIIVIQPTDKTGGLAIIPFDTYDKSIRKMLRDV